MKNVKRTLALLLVLTMCLSLLPLSAFAEGEAPEDEVWAGDLGDEVWAEEPETAEGSCEHVPLEAVTENEAAPTCTEPGSHDAVVYCTHCGEELSRETVEDPAPGHTPADAEEIPPEAGVPGHTAGVVCAVCGDVLEGCEVIKALPAEITAQEEEIAAQEDPDEIMINETNFPDAVFRAYVSDEIAGGDVLTDEMIANTTEIVLVDAGIGSLQGIAFFTNLKELNCSENSLKELDLSGCAALTTLDCSYNGLEELELAGCTALEELCCSGNKLEELKLDDCSALESLDCADNSLKELDLSGLTELTSLDCDGNPLTEVELSGCIALKDLSLSDIPSLTELELSGCTGLERVDCRNNSLAELRLRGCTSLESLDCSGNSLTALSISGCTALTSLDCSGNSLTALNVSLCADLAELDCRNNEMQTLNVSGCTALEYLDCSNNALTVLDLGSCTGLAKLDCSNNALTALNISGCTALERVECAENALTELDFTGRTALKYLDCRNNALTALNISGCTALEALDCSNNALTELDLSGLGEGFCYLVCSGNALTALDISGLPQLLSYIEEGLRATGVNAYGVPWIRFGAGPYSLEMDESVARDVLTPPVFPPERIPLQQDYLLLEAGEAGNSCSVFTVGMDPRWADKVEWAASDDGSVPLDYDPEADDGLAITLSDRGAHVGDTPDVQCTVHAKAVGTAYVVAFIRDETTGQVLVSASCRVDVAEDRTAVKDLLFSTGKLIMELYSADYPRITVIPVLEQNDIHADANDFEPVAPEEKAEGSCVILNAKFTDEALDALFGVRALDDRTLEIYPRIDLNDPEAVAAVQSSYTAEIEVTLEGDLTFSAPLKLTVKKSLPKVTAKAGKLNSFLPGSTQAVEFSTALVSAEVDWTKENPDWVRFNPTGLSVAYVGEPELRSAGGKLYLKVQPEGWNVKIPVTVSVSAANRAPKLKVKPGSLSLNPAVSMDVTIPVQYSVRDSASAALTVTPESFAGQTPLQIEAISVTEGKNEAPDHLRIDTSAWDRLYVSAGPAAPTDGKAHTYKVTLALTRYGIPTSVQTTVTVKLLATNTTISMSARTDGAIDTGIPGSFAVVNLKVKGVASPRIDAENDVTILKQKTGEDPVDVTGLFIVTSLAPDSPSLMVMPREGVYIPEPGYTYTLVVIKDFGTQIAECSVKLPVRFSDPAMVRPSVKLKASGAIDVIRPDSSVTVTPTVKNCPDYRPAYDYDGYDAPRRDLVFWKQNGEGFDRITDEEQNPFFVRVEDGAFVLTLKSGADVDHSQDKFKVSLYAEVYDSYGQPVALLESPLIPVSVKMGSAKIAQSAKTVTLLKNDRFDREVITLTPAAGLSAINWDETLDHFESPKDKNGREAFELVPLGDNSFAIAYRSEPLDPDDPESPVEPLLPEAGFKGGTVKIPVFLFGNESDKPSATVSVKVTLA